MHITELAKQLRVNAKQLDKLLLARELTDYGIVLDEIAGDLISLRDFYEGMMVEPVRGEVIPLSLRRVPVVYFLFDGEIITYVGQTFNLFSRLGQHSSKEYNGFFAVRVERKDIDIMESLYICRYLPRDNIDGKDTINTIRMFAKKI